MLAPPTLAQHQTRAPGANDISSKSRPEDWEPGRLDFEIVQLNLPRHVPRVKTADGRQSRSQARSCAPRTLGTREPPTPIRFLFKLNLIFWLAQGQNLQEAKSQIPQEKISGSRGGKFAMRPILGEKNPHHGGDLIPRKFRPDPAVPPGSPRFSARPETRPEACSGGQISGFGEAATSPDPGAQGGRGAERERGGLRPGARPTPPTPLFAGRPASLPGGHR